jgi:hypothetical protein
MGAGDGSDDLTTGVGAVALRQVLAEAEGDLGFDADTKKQTGIEMRRIRRQAFREHRRRHWLDCA